MAAESPRKGTRYSCHVVRPQPFSDKTISESVFDFISDVVPQVGQAYSSVSPKTEEKEKVLWILLEDCDVNDLQRNPNLQGVQVKTQPLLAILGYADGVQIWLITHTGDAQEVLSVRQGPVSCLRVLPTPDPEADKFKDKRPIIGVCDSSSAGAPFCGVKFVSLKTGDEVHNTSFKTLQVHGIESNKRFVVVVFPEKLSVFDACRLRQLYWITGCYPCPGPAVNPIALGDRWLAYADNRLLPVHQSCGGMSGDGSQSYAATVINAAKGAFKGLSKFGEAMVSSVTGTKPAPPPRRPEPSPPLENGHRPGIVSVVDLKSVRGDQFHVPDDPDIEGLIAHFHAHANEPVAAMAFDQSGILLVTACKLGHNFHVFSLVAHPCSSSLGAVHHLYTLHRGDTTAKVTNIAFTNDSRWVTVSTHRGTTHVFPITPYGGPICARTHCQPRVVNRISRFHKSAGLDDFEPGAAGRHSPVLSSSPGSSGPQEMCPHLVQHNALRNNMGNPRLPPYPHPTQVRPLVQIKQHLSIPGLGSTATSPASGPRPTSPTQSGSAHDNMFNVCVAFAAERWAGRRNENSKKRAVDSIFVLHQSGLLTEHSLDPKARAATGPDRASDDSPIDLEMKGLQQWNLLRSRSTPEVKPPLASNNPLVVAADVVQTQLPSADAAIHDVGEPEPPSVSQHSPKDSLTSGDHHSGRTAVEQGSRRVLDEQWVSQVEIITHQGPHRRLWMGPQFSFKTYQSPQSTTVLSSSSSSLFSSSPEASGQVTTMDILTDDCDLDSLKLHPSRSSPVAMPNTRPAYTRSSTTEWMASPGRSYSSGPLYIEAGSFEQSPILSDVYSGWAESSILRQPRGSEEEEDQLRKTLEDAMLETPPTDRGPNSMGLREDVFHDSNETLSSSGSSITAIPTGRAAELGVEPMFPSSGGSGSPDLLG
ncbi:breast carcinoma-amplified sequence 3 isoform X3 [Aplysia californica]|uniref:Breast carcinoma-amplified sequence 3 isoform X1 n=1 Tax=Aplysia californica TaxID=6500 RepID=A0ABM1W4E7_APLCA|nr:breast carcinoma-amplified sequence 3 isoform X1 [Aplysia californica]XP_035829539.1 breast carcinoma-amplified sequence 3 isoform X2 [Aplysia californica]XP_035829540.1 breast carcinoma-amplified sequence 3 isoform X3 [Aplysia californica]